MDMLFQFATAWSFEGQENESRFFSIVQDTEGFTEDEALTMAMLTVIEWYHAERSYAKKSAWGIRKPENVTWLIPFGDPIPLEKEAA